MKALIEEMVLTIEDGGKSHKENVEYAERTIQDIIRGTTNGTKEADSGGNNGIGENGTDIGLVTCPSQWLQRTGNIPRVESPFETEQKIGED